MNEKKFDDIVKEKLNELTPQGDQGIWSYLESKLEKVENSNVHADAEFDNTIKNHLLSSRPPFKSEHWRLLKAQLKTIEERKNTIFVSKILEFAAVFLIFFTFSHLSGGFLETKQKQSPASTLFANSPISDKKNNKEIFKEEVAVNPSLKKKQPKISVNTPIESSIASLMPELLTTFSATVNTTVPENVYLTNANVIPNEVISIIDNTGNDGLLFEDRIEDQKNHKQTPNSSEIKLNNIAVSLESLPLKQLDSEFALSFPLLKHEVKQSAIFSISMWAATDVNLINTPFDKFYSLASYKKEALNNSYGINFSSKKSNLELESGLGYSKRIYYPTKITEAYGVFGDNYFEKSLNKISYDVASVPINVKFHAVHSAGWSAYIMAGAALNLVLNAKYDITETLVRGRPPVGRYLPDMARLDSKPFIEGVLRGDSFRYNYFATVGFGFGIEKNIFNNTSIYIQPTYFRQVLSADIGIGPNKDKIHTSSLQIGIKTSFK